MATETFGSITVISDVGATANSYSSVANIKAQWDKNPNIDYSLIDDETIAKLAILSTESLDLEYGSDYSGTLYDEDYALFWPRKGVYDRRGVLIDDYTVFPSDLANAVAAQAWWLNEIDLIGLQVDSGVSSVKSKSLEGLGGQEYFDVADQLLASRKSAVSSDAKKWIDSLVIGGAGNGYIQVMYRG